MIIAIDLDDVLAASLIEFMDFHNKNYGTKLKKKDFTAYYLTEIMDISREEENKRVGLFDKSEHSNNIKPIDGSQKAISSLNKKHKLIIVTSRPEGLEKKTRECLLKYIPEIKEIYFIRKDYTGHKKTKAEVCKEIKADVIIEDNLGYALECANAGIKVFLMDYPWTKTKEKNKRVIRVRSWGDILRRIDKA